MAEPSGWLPLNRLPVAHLRPSRDEAYELLDRELHDARYQREFSGPLREALDRFLAWLASSGADLGPVHVPFGAVLAVLLVILAAVLCLVLVRPRVQVARSAREALDLDTGLSSAALRERAEESARSGDYSAAFRDRFRAVVRTAEERALVRLHKGLTATEAAHAIAAGHPDHQAPLSEAADRFNLSVYGGATLTLTDYREMVELDESLRQSPPRYSPDRHSPGQEQPVAESEEHPGAFSTSLGDPR
ncbi:DUF4129 domain-containing protein [Nesterenkonia flava]|uniref:DUF4129 domain-containing protein n=1 Tax=Nesterenkonia flava TaxID=469799 RepID=A0ABU1FV16_9MICC|nr:DUF4129 domain-containing protein [Nesterenkonia flava]MDR5712463.1 DUF4129 domain-containing protein [Nesterenkonia flava]